jgi:hypothetical protein
MSKNQFIVISLKKSLALENLVINNVLTRESSFNDSVLTINLGKDVEITSYDEDVINIRSQKKF